jgi:predicted Zn-dependent protease
VKEKIIETLRSLRQYAIENGYIVAIVYHEEDSYLMRFANSAISLNTNEHLIRLEAIAYDDKKRASFELITNLDKLDEMKQAIDTAAEMVGHAMPLTYQPTIPVLSETFMDERGYDHNLAILSNEERLDYFNKAVGDLETDELKLSGIFSNGANTLAQINTKSEHVQYFKSSDAQVTVVLSHETLKWEVIAEQSAQHKAELDPTALNADLAFMVLHYQHDEPQQIPLGSYDIVFGPAATAELVGFMNWIGFNGGLMKRGFSFLNEEKVGQKVFSEKFKLTDDPTRMETFPFKRDFTGIRRKSYPLFQEGVFQGFVWSQDEADEFGAKPTGHTVPHNSLILANGDQEINSLDELVSAPRDNDILYIPYLHYMNIVNPSQAIVTGSSRFGALLLKKDGSVVVPYNVRLTHSLLDIFGDKVAWLSKKTIPYNTSMSYGARNPTAVIVPNFIRVNDLEISHSNDSY